MTTAFTNAAVWPGTGGVREATVLVGGDKVLAVLDRGEPLPASASVVDLDGGALLPAFGDGHAHPVFAALEDDGPAVRSARTVEEAAEAVRVFAAADPDAEWVVGASFDRSITPDGTFDARWLDAVVPDRPVVLRASDYHTVWCNTAALRAAGIDSATPEPALGRIVRRDDGSPMGTLLEWGACDLVLDLVPPPSPAAMRRAVAAASARCAAAGLTWVLDAWVDLESGAVDAYVDAVAAGECATRFDLAFRIDPRAWHEQVPLVAAERARVEAAGLGDRLRARTVKFFADGIIESSTAAMLDCYCGHSGDRGIPMWDPDELAAAMAAFDALGMRTHVHAIGDAGVRAALDAVARVTRGNPAWDRRPTITHLQLVDPADVARLASTGVIANFQPYWAQWDDFQTNLTAPRLGERTDRQYAMATVHAGGARVSFGSDWPVSSVRPLDGLRAAVTRKRPGSAGASWCPDECLTIGQALTAYTAGAAYQAADEATRGLIRPGMVADFVHLSADPFAVEPEALDAIEVRGTWLAGHQVA
ncbi:amidohydrolase [Amycolatopsis sp. WQ 127309]|uniref:amidohydrolase n=1 Tax=Amycolatopsis sp. WQ 127309 TaxID=2932773 RepID=UPI001FF40286|nr:amidohydrolase [Amycolatopsis sp. WQ 127309]UOZ06775.1 amidohydrolase [Amycolatopsis sp. WQ 127309]